MNQTLHKFQWFSLLLFIQMISTTVHGQCENKMLDFSPNSDEGVRLSGVYPFENDFTTTLWFKTTSTSNASTCDEELIIKFQDGANYFAIYDCNGDLYMEVTPCAVGPTLISTATRNTWHHLTIRRIGTLTEIYLDCALVANTTCNITTKSKIYLGHDFNVFKPWTGQMDEITFYGKGISIAHIDSTKTCTPINFSPIRAYYSCDQGEADDPLGNPTNDNTSITHLIDQSGNGADGDLINFQLVGQTSNFICSTSPMLYPNYANFKPVFTDYPTQTKPRDTICTGDPLHICLKDSLGNKLNYNADIDSVIWEHFDGNWQAFNDPTFTGFCFPVPRGKINVDCNTSTTGFQNIPIRAQLKIKNNQGDSCFVYTQECPIKVYCPVDATLQFSTADSSSILCEGDTVDFLGQINSNYPFLQLPHNRIQINWTLIDGFNFIPFPQFSHQTNFTLPNYIVSAGSLCLEAYIFDPGSGKSTTLTQCFRVDAKPICGAIDLVADSINLKQINSSPLVYEICPGEDAIIEMISAFQNCNPTWQYTFDTTTTWQSLGSTNTLQNTNILPSHLWPSGATEIYYRIQCDPLMMPSGCPPCYSNIITVRLSPPITQPIVFGQNYVCANSSTRLYVSAPDTSLQYQWFCNGNAVAIDTQFFATQAGCYWVVATDGCDQVRSGNRCITLCEITPIISCPLAPNACPAPNETIYLTGCNSFSTCGGTLTYQWAWDSGTLVSVSGCQLAHIPLPSGTTYTLTVTNITTGCSASVSSTIIPCP